MEDKSTLGEIYFHYFNYPRICLPARSTLTHACDLVAIGTGDRHRQASRANVRRCVPGRRCRPGCTPGSRRSAPVGQCSGMFYCLVRAVSRSCVKHVKTHARTRTRTRTRPPARTPPRTHPQLRV